MDYNDSDFPSQNFHLGSEDSTKFPPGLRSYALPKFDLDESLQVHLRYDTLVERDILLGIQNPEENRWIDDFSRENSQIEFSSSAAESCSIPRHNNVWSEATSTESVEMLLKSVGQDDTLTKPIVIEESEFSGGLRHINNQVDTNLTRDDSTAPKVGDKKDSNATPRPDRSLENISDFSMDAAEDLLNVEAQAQKGRESGYGSLMDLDTCPIEVKFGSDMVSAMEQRVPPSSAGETLQEIDHISTASGLDRESPNITFDSGKVDSLDTSIQNIIVASTDGCREGTSSDERGIFLQDSAEQAKIQVLHKDSHVDDQQNEVHVVRNCSDKVGILSCSVLNSESIVHKIEEFDKSFASEADIHQIKSGVFGKEHEISGHFSSSPQEASFIDAGTDKNVESSSQGSSKDILGNPCMSAVKINSAAQIIQGYSDALDYEKPKNLLKDDSFGDGVSSFKDTEIDVQLSESSQGTTLTMTGETNNSPRNISELGNNNLAKFSNPMVCSTASMSHQKQENMKAKDGNDNLEAHGAFVTSQDPQLELTQEDCSNPDAILPDEIHNTCISHGKDRTEQQIPYSQSAKSAISLDCGLSGDDHGVPPDVASPVKQSGSLPTDSENIETKIDDPSLSERFEGSFPSQSTTMITAKTLDSSAKRTIGIESVPTDDVMLASSNNLDSHAFDVADVPDEKIKQKGEMYTCVTTETCPLVPEVSCKIQIATVCLTAADSGQLTDDNSEVDLPKVLCQSSSAENSFHSVQENQPESPKAIKPTLEHKDSEQNTLYVKIKDGFELVGNSSNECQATTSQFTGETVMNVEVLSHPITSPVDGSSDGTDHNRLHECGINLASVEASGSGQKTGVVPSGIEQGSSKPPSLSGGAETGIDSLSGSESKCDSPIIISCSVPLQRDGCQDGGENGSVDQNDTVCGDLTSSPSNINKNSDNVQSMGHDLKGTDVSEDDKGFTFVVGSLEEVPEREMGRGWKPFSNSQPFDIPQTREGSPATPGLSQTSSVILQESTPGSHKASEDQKVCRGTKNRSKEKTRVMQDVSTERESTSRGRTAKEIYHSKQMVEKDGNQSSASVYSNGTTNKAMQVKEKRQYSCVEGSTRSYIPTIQTSSLPDLNTSASSTVLFLQPFTDLQQVQLRAQIFVYGSLIQGTPPDEACMISAFGDANRDDDGRSIWENIWHVSVERYRSQKSPLSNLESPLPLRSVVRVSEQSSRCNTLQNKAPFSTPTSRSASKAAPAATENPATPIPSSVWSFATPIRDSLTSSIMPRGPVLDSHSSVSSLRPYQSPHIRPYFAGGAAWLSQASPGSAPWAGVPRTPVAVGPHYSALPITEAVQVTSSQEQSASCTPSMQLASSIPLPPLGPGNVLSGTSAPVQSAKASLMTPKAASTDQKPRKRKKGSVPQDLSLISTVASAQTEPVSATSMGKHVSTCLGIPSPVQPSLMVTTNTPVSTSTPAVSSMHYQTVGSGNKGGQNVYLSEEAFSNIEQSKLHATDAAAHAAAAVRHSEAIWNQLAIKKDSGLVPDVQAKIASAAAAAAAAVSVAKAAAAAAKVASDAALQAKLMADEALTVLPLENPSGPEIVQLDREKNFGNSTTFLQVKERTTNSDSIITATREAARKRVEATSAAVKRAENLDAVVKAAELAADAVSQAGIVIAMGDPISLTLSELVEAGPTGYWKAQKFNSGQSMKSNNIHGGEQLNKHSLDKALDGSIKNSNGKASNRKEIMQSRDEENAPIEELMVNGTHKDLVARERNLGGTKVCKTSDHTENVGVEPNLDTTRAASAYVQNDSVEHQKMQTFKENSIKEGSAVEVLRDDDSCRGVWYSGKVLSLNDGKAHVCFNDLLLDDGQIRLEEWIPLEGEAVEAPRIRIPHPMSSIKFEGSRKRQRAAAGNYLWSVGDRVDALMHDGWWEGIVTEMSNEDKTKLTVHFPAKGEMSDVRAWNLRPSLIWKDGQWMEWSRENNALSHEGDTPQEKRQKLGWLEVVIGPQIEAGGKDALSVDPSPANTRKGEESMQLPLSAKDKSFAVRRNIRDENNSSTLKTKRIGLQMEGSKVIFGVPKPGKKRKFMDVSKHYNEDKSAKIAEGTDTVKIAKYLVPQGTLGWKNTSKLDNNRGKQEQNERLKLKASKSGKARSTSRKGLSEKDNSVICASSATVDGTAQDQLVNAQTLVHHKRGILEVSKPRVGEGSQPSPSAPLSDVLSWKKFSSGSEGGGARRKLAPGNQVAGDDQGSSHDENNEKPTIADAAEPRRSNRRIQPTSRLLEGLQNSLIGTKIPSISRSKGVKASQHRNMSSFSRG